MRVKMFNILEFKKLIMVSRERKEVCVKVPANQSVPQEPEIGLRRKLGTKEKFWGLIY